MFQRVFLLSHTWNYHNKIFNAICTPVPLEYYFIFKTQLYFLRFISMLASILTVNNNNCNKFV